MEQIRWFTAKEAADILRVGVKTIRIWCADGRIKAYQPAGRGSLWLVHPSAVEPIQKSDWRIENVISTD